MFAIAPYFAPGQVLLLHTLASVLAPEQLELPKHERCRLDLPPPQLFVQLVHDSQFDQVTTAVSLRHQAIKAKHEHVKPTWTRVSVAESCLNSIS